VPKGSDVGKRSGQATRPTFTFSRVTHFVVLPPHSLRGHPEVVEAGERVGLGSQPDPARHKGVVDRLDHELAIQKPAKPVPLITPLLSVHPPRGPRGSATPPVRRSWFGRAYRIQISTGNRLLASW